jgi:hypothetical protein
MKKKSKKNYRKNLINNLFGFQRRLKEIMRIMGLKDSVHWFTWFILCTSVMMLTAILLVLLLKVDQSF